MARQSKDFLTQVREQAERTLAILTSEIRKREAELENLLEQARLWRDALTSSFAPALATSRPKKKALKKKAAKKRASAKRKSTAKKAPATKKKAKTTARKKASARGRVEWDAVLAALPATFTVDDVLKQPGARSKGRKQVYPAIGRWVKAKKARKVGKGRYKRVA